LCKPIEPDQLLAAIAAGTNLTADPGKEQS
jgi:hypothetical protein